jgi:uncharacterized membrane protein HdeD (DUF308 family)
MNKRPIPVTIVAWLLIVMGVVGIAYHFTEFRSTPPSEYLLVLFVRLLAIVCGVFLLRGTSWARLLAMAWIAFHVVVSYFHSMQEAAMHAGFLVLFALALFYPAANRYFGTRATDGI